MKNYHYHGSNPPSLAGNERIGSLGAFVGKRKPGLFTALLMGFVVVITASALTARESDATGISDQVWSQELD